MAAETVANIEELLTEILVRVPAETLIRFKRVSKYWLSLITSPSFRDSHAKYVHNKTLYICTFQEHYKIHDRDKPYNPCRRFNQYRVQAIKLSDLLPFPDTAATPITLYSSKSESSSKSNVPRKVAFIGGDDDYSVPYGMGFAAFGSRLVLAGGWFSHPKYRYASKPSYVLEIDPEARFVCSMIPDMKVDELSRPYCMQEIDGKLYFLSRAIFAVFDPKTKVWAPLPLLPMRNRSFHSCSVLGSKIFATLRDDGIPGGITFICDVASPRRSWTSLEPLLEFYRTDKYYYPEVLVVDLEDDDFEKLMFTYSDGKILVYHTLLSNNGEPNKIELASSIELPELPSLSQCWVTSYCCCHLVDRKVCFSFLYWNWNKRDNAYDVGSVLVLTLEYAHLKSGASSPPDISSSSTSDLSFLSGSFSVKTLGYHLFEYNYGEESPNLRWVRLRGCFVL